MTADLTRHETLMARSISVIDSFDHIEDMSPIGVVLDALADTVEQIREAETVLAVREEMHVDRLAAFLGEDYGDTDRTWQLSWLHTKTGCDTATAERLLALGADRYRTLAADEALHRVVPALTVAADGFADELDDLLAPHTSVVAVPDTIPDGWL